MLLDNFLAEMTDLTAVPDERTLEKQPETTPGDGSAGNTETEKSKAFITEVELHCHRIL